MATSRHAGLRVSSGTGCGCVRAPGTGGHIGLTTGCLAQEVSNVDRDRAVSACVAFRLTERVDLLLESLLFTVLGLLLLLGDLVKLGDPVLGLVELLFRYDGVPLQPSDLLVGVLK
jgi:hypothetical protein